MTADDLPYFAYNCRSGVTSNGMAEGGAGAFSRSNEAALLQLMEKTGYNIVQENGQRKYGGPPPNWDNKPSPAKGSEVFVGKIPRDCFEDELVPVFENVGRIYEFRLMMDFSGSNRGYAFVMYTTPGDAQQAVKMLNNYEIRKSKFLGVVKSVDNCRLFVGGIPKTKNKDEILEEMSKVTEGVVNVILYSSVTDKSKSRGFAFVEYENHRSAAMARRKLIPGKIQLWGQEIAVDWAEPEPEVDEETMSKVTVLYVRNLMLTTAEEELRKSFNRIKEGSVEKVKKLRDFAFIHFRSREDAQIALDAMNDTLLDGSKIEVTWAKPVEKSYLRYNKNGYPQTQQASPVGNAVGIVRSPVRTRGRGAAGVRNNGGRGGAMYVNYMPAHRVETLQDFCHKNNLGEPVFQPLIFQKDDAEAPLYIYKVAIPAFSNAFQPMKFCHSLEDAKQLAAEFVLGQLGFSIEGPASYVAVTQVPNTLAFVQQGRPISSAAFSPVDFEMAVGFAPNAGVMSNSAYVVSPTKLPYDQHAAFFDGPHQYPIQVQQQPLY